MVINIDNLDGVTLEYKEVFYTAIVDDSRLEIRELFTGLRLRDSVLEKDILRAIIRGITEQTY
jgi:hypothetical protein